MAQNEIGARSVRRRRLNACFKHEPVIEKCIQDGLTPVPQERWMGPPDDTQ